MLSSIHRLVCAVLLALVAPTLAGAHELEKVQVHATFLKDGTYRVELVLDEEHLTPQDVGGLSWRGARHPLLVRSNVSFVGSCARENVCDP